MRSIARYPETNSLGGFLIVGNLPHTRLLIQPTQIFAIEDGSHHMGHLGFIRLSLAGYSLVRPAMFIASECVKTEMDLLVTMPLTGG